MSDLTKRLYKIAKDRAFRHHHVNMYAPGDKTTHRDFIEWRAADEIERLQSLVLDLRERCRIQDKLISDNADLHDEIERLECDLAISRGKHTNAIAEIERLKAVLQDVLACCREPHGLGDPGRLSAINSVAYKALEGGLAISKGKHTNAIAEIERLRAELRCRKDEYVERQEWSAEQAMAVIKEKDAEIERLRQEREDFRQGFINAGCEAERLRAENEGLGKELMLHDKAAELSAAENERLRAALKRIESNIGFSKTFLQKIAREALSDE